MRKALCFLLVLVLTACGGSGAGSGTQSALQTLPDSGARTAQSAASPMNWTVGTGASSNAYALQDLDFYPNTITIDAGDSITYSVASGVGGDAHTVAFVPNGMPIPNPLDGQNVVPAGGTTVDGSRFVNSGILVGGQTFTLHFSRAGTYRILCLFHEPAMAGTVIVQPAGAPYPHNPSYYASVSATDRWADLGAAQTSIASFPFRNGGTTLAAGIAPGLSTVPASDSTVLRFLTSNRKSDLQTSNVTIHVGTTLTWVNETANEPHTITFPLAGQTELPNIPPDPAILVKVNGVNVYDGTHVINSGSIFHVATPQFPTPRSFSLKFTRTGRFFYGCIYHDNSRMNGWVTVVP